MVFNKYKFKPFRINSADFYNADVEGRSFKDDDGAAEDAKFYASQYSYNHGFKYFYINDLTISDGHGCKHFLMSFKATNTPSNDTIRVATYFNENTTAYKNKLFTKRIFWSTFFPVGLFLIAVPIILIAIL